MAFSSSGRVQNRVVNGHGELMDAVTIWALRGKKNGGHFCSANCRQLKSITSMQLEQRHIIKLLHLRDLKLQEIATEPSSACGQDAYARQSIKYCLHQITSGELFSKRNTLVDDHPSTMPMLNFDHF
jgi:hypothetical protein